MAQLCELPEELADSESSESKALVNLEYREIVEYINSLPPNQASVIRLKYIDEYTLKEIEDITGIPA